jgi:hypothetical protein
MSALWRRSVHSLGQTTGWRWLLLVAVMLCPACGGLQEVRGKVLFQGKPIKNAVVTFHPKNDNGTAIRPTGHTDENGVFTLSSQNESGALAGDYLVSIIWREEIPTPPGKISMEAPAPPPDKLEGRYADPASSGLTATIKRGANEIEPFELK